MELEVISVLIFLFGIIIISLSQLNGEEGSTILRDSFFWCGIILDIISLVILIPWAISWF